MGSTASHLLPMEVELLGMLKKVPEQEPRHAIMYPYMKMNDIIMYTNPTYIGIKYKTEDEVELIETEEKYEKTSYVEFYNAIVFHPDSLEHVEDVESLQLFGNVIVYVVSGNFSGASNRPRELKRQLEHVQKEKDSVKKEESLQQLIKEIRSLERLQQRPEPQRSFFFSRFFITPSPENRNPDAIVLVSRISSEEEEPVYKSIDNQVVKFYKCGQRSELIWGKSVPGGIRMDAGAVERGDMFSYQRKNMIPPGNLYSIMPFCQVLQNEIFSKSPFFFDELANSLIRNVMMIHLLGCAHNDLKPGNVMSEDGINWNASDFGLAFPWQESDFDFFRSTSGTPLYQYDVLGAINQITPPMRDTFAVAAILYEALTGTLFMNESARGLNAVGAQRYAVTMRQRGQMNLDMFERIELKYVAKIDALECSAKIKETLKALIHFGPGVRKSRCETNIWKAGRVWFGERYEDVKRSIVDQYVEYMDKVKRTWTDRVRLSDVVQQTIATRSSPEMRNSCTSCPSLYASDWSESISTLQSWKEDKDMTRKQFERGVLTSTQTSVSLATFWMLNPVVSSEWSQFLPFAVPFARIGLDQVVLKNNDWHMANARVQTAAKEFLDRLDARYVYDLLGDWE